MKSAALRLGDISLTGISVNANQTVEVAVEVGEIVPIVVKQAGLSIFEGSAKVVRTERSIFGPKIALNLVDDVVDFHSLLRRNAQARISQQLATLDPHVSGARSGRVPRALRGCAALPARLPLGRGGEHQAVSASVDGT